MIEPMKMFDFVKNSNTLLAPSLEGGVNCKATCAIPPTNAKRKVTAITHTMVKPVFFMDTHRKVMSAAMNKYTKISNAIDSTR